VRRGVAATDQSGADAWSHNQWRTRESLAAPSAPGRVGGHLESAVDATSKRSLSNPSWPASPPVARVHWRRAGCGTSSSAHVGADERERQNIWANFPAAATDVVEPMPIKATRRPRSGRRHSAYCLLAALRAWTFLARDRRRSSTAVHCLSSRGDIVVMARRCSGTWLTLTIATRKSPRLCRRATSSPRDLFASALPVKNARASLPAGPARGC